jgi:hypothetical protein
MENTNTNTTPKSILLTPDGFSTLTISIHTCPCGNDLFFYTDNLFSPHIKCQECSTSVDYHS